MIKVLFVTPIPAEYRSRFTEIAGTEIEFVQASDVTDAQLMDADVVMGNLPMDRLAVCDHLQWVQLNSAGANTYKDLAPSIQLTNASGAYGPAISEHMIGCVLMVMKNLANYMEVQKNHDFTNLGSVNTLGMSKVLAVGMGDIGSSFAKKMHALGAEVYGVRRSVHDTPDYVKQMYTMDTMDEILGECDVVALSLPETEETVHLFDYERLSKIKKGAILVNVGRGTAIVTDDLVRLQKEDHFSGICLDVTDPEPLPRNHPLWNMKHVYLTPHISGRFNAAVTFDRVLDIFENNLRAFTEGRPLQNIVDKSIGY